MIALLAALVACTNAPPAEPDFDLVTWTNELCTSAESARVPLHGALPPAPSGAEGPDHPPWPRLAMDSGSLTWLSLPVAPEDLAVRVARHPVPPLVVVQITPDVPAAEVAPLMTVLRTAGVTDLRAAVRIVNPPTVPPAPFLDQAAELEGIADPRRRMDALAAYTRDTIGDCGHARLAFDIAETETGSRCGVWKRQLVPSLGLCPELDPEAVATLIWLLEHAEPDAFWTTVPVPEPVPTTGSWAQALGRQ